MQTVSVIMGTYNSKRTLESCLHSVTTQNYPKNLIQVIAADGGSTDGTLDILNKYHATIIHEHSGSPEKAKAIALRQAQGKLILFLPSDNILPHKNWLKNMTTLLERDSNVVAVYPRYYGWRKQDTYLSRYFALLGANDPVAWFLGKADRKSYLDSVQSKDMAKQFSEDTMPTLGDNGFLIKKNILVKAMVDPDHFYHIDVCLDLVRLGYNQFYECNEIIYHDTGETLVKFLKKRYRYMTQLYLQENSRRRYNVYNPKTDFLRLVLFCLYTMTMIGPVVYSLRGYLNKRDVAWFIHPVMCWGIMMIYAYSIGQNQIIKDDARFER